MNRRNFLVKIVLIAFSFSTAACQAQATSVPVAIAPATLTPIPPTETPTLTPTPEPTSTPTITPTPIGGKNGLLLNQSVRPANKDCVQTVFLYNLVSQELTSFLDGYWALDVSPEGRQVLLTNPGATGNLFILDMASPERITPLQQNVEDATWLGDSGWIGFIFKVNGKRQVFLIHPDGNDLTQVTNSSIGAVTLEPVFNDGVIWGKARLMVMEAG